MKRNPNYLKNLLQWGVLLWIVVTVVVAAMTDKKVDVEAYCPFGGLQALGSFWVNNSLACSMSMIQIMMGVMLAVGVILFSKLFCGYLCPLGTVGEWMSRMGRRLKLQREVRVGGYVDRLLRSVKYVVLFWILYNTLSTSELFCKKLDPFYAVATGFQGEIVLWMSCLTLALLLLGGFFVRMFWCRYICPLGALSNIFKFTPLVILAGVVVWLLTALEVEKAWVWVLGVTSALSYLIEILRMKRGVTPLLYIHREVEGCTHCGHCERQCPYALPITSNVKLNHVDCTLCGECIASCPTGVLQINGRKRLRWLPGVITVVLALVALYLGNVVELPTIDEKWGKYEQISGLQTYSLEGLQTVKCFGSSKALSAKMQAERGVYGIRTFVKRHAVEVLYNPEETDSVNIQRVLFSPMQRKYRTPAKTIAELQVLHLGIEGLHDRMDIVYFGMALQKVEGLYGFTAEFNCPIDVRLFVDPKAGISEEQLTEIIEAEELVFPTQKEVKHFPMHNEVKDFEVGEMISREEFGEVMFREVKRLGGRFAGNVEQWGDAEKFPTAVYEMEYPSIEKPPVRGGVPYLKSYLSCLEGILGLEFALRDMIPVMRIEYVKSMWNDERIWEEVLQNPQWTIRMSDGTEEQTAARMKFTKQGRTLEE